VKGATSATTSERYRDARHEMAPFVPRGARVLDVGCAGGDFGAHLRGIDHAREVWGIDVAADRYPHNAAYERMINGSFPADLPPGESFDCIVFNDVLEHLLDPWLALRVARERLRTNGVVVASVPNIRHWRVIRQLVFAGDWNYTEHGILDKTHLRFFTRRSARALFDSCGFAVIAQRPITAMKKGRAAAVNRLFAGHLSEFLTIQYAIVARPTSPPPPQRGGVNTARNRSVDAD
jgi:SAM-dependent methyltransferase